MKNMKTIFTIVLCIAMICVVSVSELLYCTHSTLMSPGHFTTLLDDEQKLSQLTVLLYGSLADSTASDRYQAIKKYAVNILNKCDQTWVKSQIYIGASGLQKYIASEATTLPTLDFVPLKTIIKESIITEIMKQPQALENVDKVKTVLSILNNKYFSAIIKYGLSNQLVTMLLELAPIQSTGFDRATVLEIIKVYLSFSNKSTTLDQASYSIVEQMAAKSFELDKLKDYFDMGLFLEKAFGDDNPVAAFKTFINRVDTSISLSTKVLFWCFMLLLWINLRFSLIKLLRTILYCISLASIFNVLLSALLINPISSQKLITLFTTAQVSFNNFWVKLWVFLLRDFGFYLALQSVFISIIAGFFYLTTKRLFKKTTNINVKIKVHRFSTWRFTALFIVFTLVFSWWSFSSIAKDTKTFHSNVQKLLRTDINKSVVNGLKEAGGMEFLKYVQKK
ncbi:MAG TPA: hypothetical protein VEF53_11395 [Patescibacteria group bacterium]|nr:hypothetical protein [Patescibacteria group bacterium]